MRTTRQALTAADVGAWLFTCHPRELAELLAGGRVNAWCVRPSYRLDLALLDAPPPRDLLRADARTARMEVLRAAQRSNPSVVMPGECAAMAELLGPPASRTVGA